MCYASVQVTKLRLALPESYLVQFHKNECNLLGLPGLHKSGPSKNAKIRSMKLQTLGLCLALPLILPKKPPLSGIFCFVYASGSFTPYAKGPRI